MVVYADVLFLINFSMDFLALWFTAKMLGRSLKKNRAVWGALVGSVLGSVWSLLFPDVSPILSVIIGFVLSVLMCLTAYEKGTGALFWRSCFALWGSGMLIGGVMTCLLSRGTPVYRGVESKADAFFLTAVLCAVISAGILRLFRTGGKKKCADVAVQMKGKEYRFTALLDSGSFAVDPISGLPALLVRDGIFPAREEREMSGWSVRILPVSGIGGQTVLYGFVPERLTVNGAEKRGVIGIWETSGSFGGYDGLLPLSLI